MEKRSEETSAMGMLLQIKAILEDQQRELTVITAAMKLLEQRASAARSELHLVHQQVATLESRVDRIAAAVLQIH